MGILIKTIIIVLSVGDILFGLFLLPFFLVFQGAFFILLLGILYLIFGFSALFNVLKTRLLLYAIFPLSVISSIFIVLIGNAKNAPKFYRTPMEIQIIVIGILMTMCFVNMYFFTRQKTKQYFKRNTRPGDK